MQRTAIHAQHERKGFPAAFAITYAPLGLSQYRLQRLINVVIAKRDTCNRQVGRDVHRPHALSTPCRRTCSGCLCPLLDRHMLTNLRPQIFIELWALGEGPCAPAP